TGGSRCVYVFRPGRRLSATVRVELAVHADANIDHLVLLHRVEVYPPLFPVQEQDRLALRLDDVEDKAVTSWIEGKLLTVVDLLVALEGDPLVPGAAIAGRVRAAA